jgi:membrane-bound acyltransferase YfiQ involved in biofilm formation
MKKNIYEELPNEKLIQKRDLLKGVLIGISIVIVLSVSILGYVFFNEGLKKVSMVTFLPIFMLPITFGPLLINLGLLNKEIKARNL